MSHQLYVACSGGRDSLVLAYGCLLLYRQGVLQRLPTLLHVHHGMQVANDAWAVFVDTWARQWGFDCQILRIKIDKKTETHARAARYQALLGAMVDDGVLLLAHHADDQAETLLMRLMSGAGVQGMSGMRAWQVIQMAGRNITLHRPLLHVSRQAITTFAHTHALPYVDDPTNEGVDNVRSVIRNDILPRLAMMNPKVRDNIARTAHLMSDANHLIEEVIHELYQKCRVEGGNHPFVSRLDTSYIRTLTPPKQSALIRHYIQGDEGMPPTHRTVMEVIALIHRTNHDHQTQVFWQAQKGAYTICRYKETLYRYHQGLFLLLKEGSDVVGDRGGRCEGMVVLKERACWQLVFDAPKFWQTASLPLKQDTVRANLSLIRVGACDDVKVYQPYMDKRGEQQVAFKKLSGKKLYQTLNIPTWHRQNLWVVHIGVEPVLLMTMEQSWLLEGAYFDEFMKGFDDKHHAWIRVERHDEAVSG